MINDSQHLEWSLDPESHEAGGKPVGSFYCIYGNSGWDVISDYSWIDTAERNTQSVMDELDAAGTAVAEKWEAIL